MTSSFDSSTAKKFYIALLVSAVIQSWIAIRPDTMADVLVYRDWCRELTKHGIVRTYSNDRFLKARGTEIDYPPVYPYILMAIGKVLNFFTPELFATSNRFVEAAIKLLSVLANLLIALLLFIELRDREDAMLAGVAASAYAFNPAAIFNTAYWGQTEAISTLLVLASFLLLLRKLPECSWAILVVAVFMKPVALPFLPLIALATWKLFGWKRILSSTAASVVTFLLIFLPFLLTGRFQAMMKTVFFQIDAMPYLSVNAHNLWWIIQGGRPWVPALSLHWKLIAIALFGTFYIVTLFRYWNSRRESSLYIAAASIAFGFFVLYTHMHENHLFQFLPLLTLFFFSHDRLRKIYLLITLTFFFNMVLHDPWINHLLEPYSIGPKIETWSGKAPEYPIYKTFRLEGKGYVVEETTGEISATRFFLSLLNSQLNCLIFFYWLLAFYLRGKSFEEQNHPRPLFTKSRVMFAILFFVITAIPFLLKLQS